MKIDFLNLTQGQNMSISLEYKAVTYPQYVNRWLSSDDVSKEYGFSKSSLAKMRMLKSNSRIPFSKIGGKYIRYDRLALDKWLEDHQVQGA